MLSTYIRTGHKIKRKRGRIIVPSKISLHKRLYLVFVADDFSFSEEVAALAFVSADFTSAEAFSEAVLTLVLAVDSSFLTLLFKASVFAFGL